LNYAGDYALLHNALSAYDWSSLYNKTSVDAAVERLSVVATEAINSPLPCGHIEHINSLLAFLGN
jgi:hypothetical protein